MAKPRTLSSTARFAGRRNLNLMSRTIYTAADSEADTIQEEWGSLSWKAGAEIGNALGLSLGRMLLKKGQRNPRHGHSTTEQILYVIKGRVRHSLGDEEVIIEAGDTLHVPAGVYHDAENIGDCDADLIVAHPTPSRDFVLERT